MLPAEHIQKMVDRETAAWNAQDAAALVDLFHPDMVWPWPPDLLAHDPAEWVMPMGRYDRGRWQASWQDLFDTHELVHNQRDTVRIAVSEQGDGGLAVVDIDTLWRHRDSDEQMHWIGRTCKVYTQLTDGWKLIMHTGVLDYSVTSIP